MASGPGFLLQVDKSVLASDGGDRALPRSPLTNMELYT